MTGVAYPFVAELLAPVDQRTTVLEVGCGGQQYRTLVPGRYIGLDLPGTPYAGGAPFLAASAEDVPLRTASVDLVFGVAVFLAISDVDRAFRECHRVLAPGGRLIVIDYQAREGRRLRATDPRHHHDWTRPQLVARLANAGFDPTTARDRSAVPDRRRHAGWARWGLRGARRLLGRSTWLVVEVTR